MTFTTALANFDTNLWGFHIVVQEAQAQPFIDGNDRRVVCTLNGSLEFQCALMPKGDGHFFININKKTRDKLGLQLGSMVAVSLRKDESEFGLPMPEEFAEVLAQDQAGNRHFRNLTPGKQRALLYIVGQPKTSDTRLKRAVVLVEHLKDNAGKIDFKQLQLDLKETNRFGF
ncbi:MAG: YdeI/OmpD-associated family protein [Saprospiraceae bacterium]|nr:YdeI/OmpD-associated family protein [Saprospiraceae bacterium]MCF8252562.1 YdeI/OmpD-associated family protein [Saprospiraceae bacterium]MCF8282603.1 YdeI/OmpD-associated family protein [Bacteroidales bacterium]MCF8314150.1 YdeI/OmpD-associated family protein [Saprospiraceae bacterium]MCF8442914.1 YdeI/OmpD-associated family protein [Saprospiraceae bacterium]